MNMGKDFMLDVLVGSVVVGAFTAICVGIYMMVGVEAFLVAVLAGMAVPLFAIVGLITRDHFK